MTIYDKPPETPNPNIGVPAEDIPLVTNQELDAAWAKHKVKQLLDPHIGLISTSTGIRIPVTDPLTKGSFGIDNLQTVQILQDAHIVSRKLDINENWYNPVNPTHYESTKDRVTNQDQYILFIPASELICNPLEAKNKLLAYQRFAGEQTGQVPIRN